MLQYEVIYSELYPMSSGSEQYFCDEDLFTKLLFVEPDNIMVTLTETC